MSWKINILFDVGPRANKAFKSDSQRLAFLSLRWVLCFRWYGLVMWQRCSHLNAALCVRASQVN